MTITFKCKLRDYFWFTSHCCFESIRRSRWVFIGFAACCLFVALPYLRSPASALAAVSGYALISVVGLGFALFLFTVGVCLLAKLVAPAGASAFHEQQLALGDARVIVESNSRRIEIDWREVRVLVQTRHYFVLRFQEFGALLIPRRAFLSEAQKESFLLLCGQRLQAG